MNIKLGDRIRDFTLSTGTENITLLNTSATGFRTFAAGLGNSSCRTTYSIVNSNGEWEIGIGTFDGNVTLTRDIVLSSSNSGSLVNFSVGKKDIFVTTSTQDFTTEFYTKFLLMGA